MGYKSCFAIKHLFYLAQAILHQRTTWGNDVEYSIGHAHRRGYLYRTCYLVYVGPNAFIGKEVAQDGGIGRSYSASIEPFQSWIVHLSRDS